MKKLLFSFLIVIGSISLYSQAPEGFSYHAIVNNNAGDPVVSQAVSFRFNILKGSPLGSVVYGEKHDVITDQFGAVSLIIGNGTYKTGDFVTIDWGADSYFINISIDTTGGTFYTDMGTMQFLSVPYALYANKAGNGFSGDYTDLTNKPITNGSETNLMPGVNITITGMGTINDPYKINSESKVTAGDNIKVTGSGTKDDPYIINERIHYAGESYGGGIVFYVYDSGRHGLIAATTDQDPGIEWYNGTKRYTNTTGDGVGAGSMNTNLIIALQTNDNQTGNFAAKVCADYSVTENGVKYGDWYLPSKFELAIMFTQKDAIGGFSVDYYWSSTEFSSISAWSQNFSDGIQYNLNKSLPYGVRAIRAF